MRPGLNRVQLHGFVAHPPVRKSTHTGEIVTFELAVPEGEGCNWHRVVVRKEAALDQAEAIRPGDDVFLEGALQYRRVEARNGGHKVAEILVGDQGRLIVSPAGPSLAGA